MTFSFQSIRYGNAAIAIAAMSLTIVAAGCFPGSAGGPELAPVTGVVTIDGKPTPNVQVLFEPLEDGGASRGLTDDDGKFRVYFSLERSGAIPGAHRVQFEIKEEGVDPRLIPAKYAFGAKGIEVEVSAEGPNDFQFDLTGK